MGKETEIDLYNSDDSEFTFDEQTEDTVKGVLDERDYILPLKEAGAGSRGRPEAENSPDELESEIALETGDELNPDDSDSTVSAEDMPDETDILEEDNSDPAGSEADEAELLPEGAPVESKSGKTAAGEKNLGQPAPKKLPPKQTANQHPQGPKVQKNANRSASANKIISLVLIMLIAAGFVLYYNPALVGLSKAAQPATPAPGDAVAPLATVPPTATAPSPPSKRDQCVAKIEEANLLRNELLAKKEEIYELDLHYRSGIVELEDEIFQEIARDPTASYEAALKNKRIELNLRTIQRRLAYIQELARPAYWLDSGSEELFFLVRKARLDLQLAEIAGGIDLNKHMRHISAAIQKYRPSAENLAIDPLQSKPQPLETIWQQVKKKADNQAQVSQNPKDEIIMKLICAENYDRLAELTSISSDAARCLARMKGSDLFLNGLTTLSPDAAKQLFQWPGNWICLNGLKQLSPATAQYLFKWKGQWISLNSLDRFPPELAMHLLKWEGQQLELMGLKYSNDEAGQKTLKYLALWVTTGGKLFVSDKVRQEMENLM